ncbi:MAG: hypothetical protein JNM31_12765 [Flavobacteriales bacterium]|nr:hypothetical protein [Flavobacteriales bacterium]
MSNKTNMIAETRSFVRLGLLAFIGFGFYYAHLLLGFVGNQVLAAALAVSFLLCALPLPIIAMGNRKLFAELGSGGKAILNAATILTLLHHFLLTFLFLMFVGRTGEF